MYFTRWLILFFLVIPAFGQTKTNPLVLTNVTIIDVKNSASLTARTVVIQSNRITKIGQTGKVSIPKKAQVIDAAGKFLIPGLWDMHVHLGDEEFDKSAYLPLFIVNGVTGIRIMEGAPPFFDWRAAAESGKILSPRMYIASQMIGSGDLSNLSPVQIREEIRKAKKSGADFIKVHDSVTRDSYAALMDEAGRVKLPVEGHVPASMTAAEVSEAGQKSIEHFTGLDAAKSDKQKAIELFRILKKNQTWLCPTLVMRHNYGFLNDPNLPNDSRLRFAKPSWRNRWLKMSKEAQKWSPDDIAVRKETIRKEDNLIAAMQSYGLGILAGTDDANPFVIPGFSLHDELALLVKAGLTPMQALQTATVNPAKFFKQFNEWGSIEKGKLAELVLLDADPLVDIRNTTRINAVIVGGNLFNRQRLNELLEQIEMSARQK